MKRVTKSRTGDVLRGMLPLALATALLISMNIGLLTAQQKTQQSFASPKQAVEAVVSAAKAEDMNQLMRVFGPDAQAILYSGDQVADKQTRDKFLQKYNEMSRLVTQPNGSVDLYLGAENWPFPIPLVKKNGGWVFDTATGKKEILYRRVGRNEFDTIDTLQALVDAQKEYASQPRDGGEKQYAQKILSDPDKHNGLYWPTVQGQPPSPAGPLLAEAFSEGYRKQKGPTPFHGYIYRLHKRLSVDKTPGLIGTVCRYTRRNLLRTGSQILLIDFAVLIHHKGHHSRIAILRGISEDGKPSGQFSIHEIILRTARGVWTLSQEQPVDVSMKWSGALLLSVTFAECFGKERPSRARRLTLDSWPIESIVFARVTHDFLRILFLSAVSRLAGILLLRIDDGLKRIDGVKFIPADPTIENLLLADRRIENPASIFLNQRNGEGPVFRSEIEIDRSVGFADKPAHLVVLCQELVSSLFICDLIAGVEDGLGIGSKNPHQLVHVFGSGGRDQGCDCILRRGIRLLGFLFGGH